MSFRVDLASSLRTGHLDGRWIIFVETMALYVVRPDGGGRRRISGGVAGDPAWSPDGQMIAYASGKWLVVANADGKEPRKVARAALEIYGPQWSPDSKRIVYSGGGMPENDLDLYVVTIATKQAVRLTQSVGSALDPAWSPDGKTIAFVHRPPAGPLGALEIVRPNGTGRRALLRDPNYSSPAWSPDNTRIAVVRGGEPISSRDLHGCAQRRRFPTGYAQPVRRRRAGLATASHSAQAPLNARPREQKHQQSRDTPGGCGASTAARTRRAGMGQRPGMSPEPGAPI